jgi:hypothetical protein
MASKLFWKAASPTVFLSDIIDNILFQASWEFNATFYIHTLKNINCYVRNSQTKKSKDKIV